MAENLISSFMMKAPSFNDLKSSEIDIEKVIKSESHISEIDINNLKIDVLNSGFASLDDMMFLKKDRGELIFIAGRPSMGKSALLFQLAENASHDKGVYVVSLEMDKEQILTRYVAKELGKSITDIQKGKVSLNQLKWAKDRINNAKYFINDSSGSDINVIVNEVVSAYKRHNIGLVVIDYLQLMRVGEKGHSKDAEIGTITGKLKQLGKTIKTPILVGCQLNRACELRGKNTGDYRPMLSDLRESGNIEQDADMVVMLHRDSYYQETTDNTADLIIAKNRNGPCGTVTLEYIAEQTKFQELDGSY